MQLAIIDEKTWTYKLSAAEKAHESAKIDELTCQVQARSLEFIVPEVTGVPAPTWLEIRKTVAKEYRKQVRKNIQAIVNAEIAKGRTNVHI